MCWTASQAQKRGPSGKDFSSWCRGGQVTPELATSCLGLPFPAGGTGRSVQRFDHPTAPACSPSSSSSRSEAEPWPSTSSGARRSRRRSRRRGVVIVRDWTAPGSLGTLVRLVQPGAFSSTRSRGCVSSRPRPPCPGGAPGAPGRDPSVQGGPCRHQPTGARQPGRSGAGVPRPVRARVASRRTLERRPGSGVGAAPPHHGGAGSALLRPRATLCRGMRRTRRGSRRDWC